MEKACAGGADSNVYQVRSFVSCEVLIRQRYWAKYVCISCETRCKCRKYFWDVKKRWV